ncbi:MAG: cysteine-rich CWC family protein [Burkholderiaceae bacterium]|nr:cysteine-rich CWC family protein [Burkholderiaceae bacterium]
MHHTPDAEPAFSARCARCGVPFQCGVDAPDGCWCARLPMLPAGAIDADRGCLCEACLQAVLAARSAACGARG